MIKCMSSISCGMISLPDVSSIMGTSQVENFSQDSTLPSFQTPKNKQKGDQQEEPESDSFCLDMVELGIGEIRLGMNE